MTAAEEIKPEQIDELLAYLPVLVKPGRRFVKEWAGASDQALLRRRADGSMRRWSEATRARGR